MLTRGGWLGAISIATIIIFGFGYKFLIYPITFLALGSLVSRINKNEKDKYRNLVQVFSNAGVALFCCILYLLEPNALFINAYILSFAVALSDTFSSELGKYFNGKTIDIVRLQKVQIGLSGGISIQGTLAGVIGSMIIACIGTLIIEIDLKSILEITTYGTFGMILDSILGSTVQAKYSLHGEIREEGELKNLISGHHWVDNNLVNFLSILLTVCIYLILQ